MKKNSTATAEKEIDEKFLSRLKKLKKWVHANPYDIEAHETLSALYLSKRMYSEAEAEQEILEWLDRIKRIVREGRGMD